MVNSNFISLRLIRFMLTCVCLGCSNSEGLERVPVSGQVTLNGKPAQEMTIYLEPISQEGKEAAGSDVVSAPVVDGHFEIDEQHGPRTGDYRVKFRLVEPESIQVLQARKKEGGINPLMQRKEFQMAIKRQGPMEFAFTSEKENEVLIELKSR